MSFVVTTLRRSLWLILIGAVGGAAWAWWRDQNAPPSPSAPPEWPPLDTSAATTSTGTSTSTGTGTSTANEPPAATETSSGSADDDGAQVGAASIVNALVDAPDARSAADTGTWVAPNDDGSCPIAHPVKANDNSGIFHVPGGRFYERTGAERCYSTPEAAEADGYRQAKA